MCTLYVLFQDNESDQEDFSDSDSDIPDELKQDYIDELTGETHNRYLVPHLYTTMFIVG